MPRRLAACAPRALPVKAPKAYHAHSSFQMRHREESMRKFSLAATVSLTALALSSSQPLLAQSEADQLGNVNFKPSCNEVAQRRFDRGMRYQHSFWYSASKSVFEDVLKADPDCTIANWGI